MTEPRLTIGIPTLDRGRFLAKAIDSCLAQTVPARILVADQGESDSVAETMRRYKDHPLVHHVKSGANSLWSNWKFAADHVETEFFAWTQDDDVISRSYTARILDGFDRWPDADMWTARLAVADEHGRALWFLSNGPWMPLRLLDGAAGCFDSDLIIPTSYFTAWALSPAVAFRRGDRFTKALDRMPDDCALYNERLLPAAMASGGRFIADPSLAGYWVQHSGNESRKQHPDQPRQTVKAIEWLDCLMEDDGVAEKAMTDLDLWCAMMPVGHLYTWAECVAHQGGRWEKRIGEILVKHVKSGLPRVMPGMTPIYGMDGRASEYAYAAPSPHEVLTFN